MNKFRKYIIEISKVAIRPIPKNLQYKIDIAQKIIDDIYENETSAERKIPYYLNDLGIREFEDIRKEMDYLSRKYNFRILSTAEIENCLMNIDINKLSQWFDMAIFMTGDYVAVENVIEKRFFEIITINNYRLYIYSATVLAVQRNEKAKKLFLKAQDISVAKTILNVAIAKHRLAVAELKRFRNIETCEKMILEIMSLPFSKLTEKTMILALVNNLYALCFIMKDKDNWKKFELLIVIENAKKYVEILLSLEGATFEEKDQAVRYLSQININRAQIMQKNKQYSQSVAILEDNLKIVEQYAPFYLSEALGTLGYAYFLNNEFKQAVIILTRAKKVYIDEGAIKSIILINKLLLVSNFQLNNSDEVDILKKELLEFGENFEELE